jgi:hypothetical protein
LKGCQYAREKWTQIAHSIANAEDEHDSNADTRQILLVSKRLICGDKDFEASINRCPQKNAVF